MPTNIDTLNATDNCSPTNTDALFPAECCTSTNMDIQSHTELTELTDIISFDASLSVISVGSVCLFRTH